MQFWTPIPPLQGVKIARRITILGARGDRNVPVALASMESATQGITSALFEFDTGSDLPAVFNAMQVNEADGIIVIAGGLTFLNLRSIAELSLAVPIVN